MLVLRRRRRTKVATSSLEAPDVAPMIGVLYRCFLRTGINPMLATSVAIQFVIDDLWQHIVTAGFDIEVTQRLAALDVLIRETETYSGSLRIRTRIMFWANSVMICTAMIWFVLMFARVFR